MQRRAHRMPNLERWQDDARSKRPRLEGAAVAAPPVEDGLRVVGDGRLIDRRRIPGGGQVMRELLLATTLRPGDFCSTSLLKLYITNRIT